MRKAGIPESVGFIDGMLELEGNRGTSLNERRGRTILDDFVFHPLCIPGGFRGWAARCSNGCVHRKK